MKSLILISVIGVSAMAKDIKVSVKGMVCGLCAQGIEKKLKANPDVQNIKIDLESKTVRIDIKDNAEISNDKLKKVFEDSGFNIDDKDIVQPTAPDKKRS